MFYADTNSTSTIRCGVLWVSVRGSSCGAWWAQAAGAAAVCAGAAGGNAAVLAALRRARPRRHAPLYPLLSLAAADLLVGVAVLPLATARELFVFQLEGAVCTVWAALDVLGCTASILSLCALGVARLGGVTQPLARAARVHRARVLAALVWPVSLAVALPSAFIPAPAPDHDGPPQACLVNTNFWYVVYSSSLSFYLPAVLMLVVYARILSVLRAAPRLRAHRGPTATPVIARAASVVASPMLTQSTSLTPEKPPFEPLTPVKSSSFDKTAPRTPQAPTNAAINNDHYKIYLSPRGTHLSIPGVTGARSPKLLLASLLSPATLSVKSSDGVSQDGMEARVVCAMQRRRRVARTIVLLMTTFLVCWTPFFVMLPIDAACRCVSEGAWAWCTWLGYANSALNPLVYAVSHPATRRHLKRSLHAFS